VLLASPEERSVYTSRGRTLEYDALLLAAGGRAQEGILGAVTFGGPGDTRAVAMLLEDLERGLVHHVLFAIPTAVGWTLPVYEIALLTAERLAESGIEALVSVVTPEEAPLAAFGQETSDRVMTLLRDRRVEIHAGVHPQRFVDAAWRSSATNRSQRTGW
jgi:sulfide:quinone oxidoreductase